MTEELSPDENIRTKSEFEDALSNLLLTAYANDVDITGSWLCRTDEDGANWEAIITELADTAAD